MKIKWNLKAVVFLCVGLATTLFYQNCAKPVSQSDSASVEQSGLTNQDILTQKSMQVLVTNCSKCHNDTLKSGGVNVLDTNEMLANGLIVPGEPSLSLIFTSIQSGQMPPSKALPQVDVQAVFDWVSTGFTANTPVVTPNPPTTSTLTATYASIAKNILAPKCMGCHNSNNVAGGISFANYNSTMNTVQKGLPNSSSLYTSTAIKRTMPRGGNALSSSETQAISDWITNGALNN